MDDWKRWRLLKMKILITGSAGFIGFSLCKKLIEEKIPFVGIDNLNSYYDITLKKSRESLLKEISIEENVPYEFINCDIENNQDIHEIFLKYNPETVIHFAAQAGVRYSLENPFKYIESNLKGFGIILENCRKFNIKNFIFASSSSIYGGNQNMPFSETDPTNHPISLYAATKKANELMAHSYSHLYNLPCTGLRFFTVYGPWGRPDMAPMIFAKAILENKEIKIFNGGRLKRDFTFIDDVSNIIYQLIFKPAEPDKRFNNKNPNPSTSWAPYRIFNIGNNKSIPILDFVSRLEKELNIKAKINFLPMQSGDVKETFASTSLIEEWIGLRPNTSLDLGIKKFVEWYKSFYRY